MDYRSLGKSAASRKAELEARIAATKEDLAAMENELVVLDGILKAIPADSTPQASRGPARKPRGTRGKWKPGSPGRPPKWFREQQQAEAGAAGGPGTPPAERGGGRKAKRGGKAGSEKAKRPPSEKQLAAMAKAREALAARRAAAAGASAP